MPDRELPQHLRSRLSAFLESGAPLVAPLPAQARYATARAAILSPRWRLRALSLALASGGIVVVAFAGPPQPRDWIVQSVSGITRQLGVPAGAVSPSPSNGSQSTGGQSTVHRSPDEAETPQPQPTPEPQESPESGQSPESGGPAPSPGDTEQSEPTSAPTPIDH
jgi:hypothetical protein